MTNLVVSIHDPSLDTRCSRNVYQKRRVAHIGPLALDRASVHSCRCSQFLRRSISTRRVGERRVKYNVIFRYAEINVPSSREPSND